MHIKWTVAYEYDGHFKPTIIYLSCFITKLIKGPIVCEFMYSLGNRLIVCPYTLDTMNSYKIIFNVMSDREPTRWQHNRIYPHPINPCVYTYDSICHLQISIYITILK